MSVGSGWKGASAASQGDQAPSFAPELDCLRESLHPQVLEAAATRARAVNIGADRALAHAGLIGDEDYARALALDIGVAFDDLATTSRMECPLTDSQLIQAPASGLLLLTGPRHQIWVVAPQGHGARRIKQLLASRPDLLPTIRITTSAHLQAFVARVARTGWGDIASHGLTKQYPHLSAAPQTTTAQIWHRWGFWLIIGALAVLLVAFPQAWFQVFVDALALWFLGFILLRLIGALMPRPAIVKSARIPDDQLPVYTIIAALYREAESVRGLVEALRAFDYPREKLDIKFAIEEDDAQTRAALARLGPLPGIEIVTAPPIGPRTKPKALNAALPFARGTFAVVYDAEDRPEPDQLRKALDAFRLHGDDLACAQASLCIDNGRDSWLTRMFTAEYAGQFDVFLPGFARMKLPLPLGGSSNHFRTHILRAIGAWDAYNVTEDADLGLRLARFGYRSVTIESTTFEEAPARFSPWLKQRTRWLKGWLQTWLVHMRAPVTLWREIGPLGFVTLQFAIGGSVVAALVHPFFMLSLLVDAVQILRGSAALDAASINGLLHDTTIICGYLSAIIIGWMGLAQRRLTSGIWVLAFIPLYWLLLSLAAWRALWQLVRDPYRWEKTEHGLARSSRFVTTMKAQSRSNVVDRLRRPRRNA